MRKSRSVHPNSGREIADRWREGQGRRRQTCMPGGVGGGCKSVASILLALGGLAWVVMARDGTLQTLMGMPESEQVDHNEQ
jgi:hypothetical protein